MSILTVRPVNEEMGAELTGETLELIISLILQHKPEQKHLPHGGSYFQFHRRCSPAKERKESDITAILNSLGLSRTHSPTQSA